MLTLKEIFFFQAKGQRYEYGDFVLKFGQVSAGPSFKGLVVEVWGSNPGGYRGEGRGGGVLVVLILVT